MAEPSAQSNLVALADAIVAALNAAQPEGGPSAFAEAFTAVRRFAPIIDLASVRADDAPLVHIIPIGDDEQRQGGGDKPHFMGSYQVDCVIYARAGAAGSEAAETRCEELMLLRGQIRDFFKPLRLRVVGHKGTYAVLDGVDGSPAYGQDSLITKHCFVSAQTFAWAIPV